MPETPTSDADGAATSAGSGTPARSSGRGARRRTVLTSGIAAAVVLGLAGGAVAVVNRPTEAYRTAEVTTSTVTQSVAASGTITSVMRSDAAFGTAGTVASVDVAVGDEVVAGQRLATLDTDELADAVEAAQESLDEANDQLAANLEAQASGTTSAASTTGTGTSTTQSGATIYLVAVANLAAAIVTAASSEADDAWAQVDAARAAVQAAQDALLAQYDVVDAAVGSSSSSSAAAQNVCNEFLASSIAQDGSTDLSALAAALTACQESISTVLADMSLVVAEQAALLEKAASLDEAVAALDAAVAAARDAEAAEEPVAEPTAEPTTEPTAEPTSEPTTEPGGEPTDGAPSDGATAGGAPSGDVPSGDAPQGSEQSDPSAQAPGEVDGGSAPSSESGAAGGAAGSGTAGTAGETAGATGTTITAERILADRAAVALAETNLAIAQAAAAMGELASPIDGTVASVSLVAGDSVTASSTTSVITVLGEGGYVLTTTLDLADVALLAVGQSMAGTTGNGIALTGEVSRIGLTNTSSTSTPSYVVEIAITDPTEGLLEGSTAQVEIEVAAREDVLVVPTSAVHVSGSSATVDVLAGGEVTAVEVEVGAIGGAITEITAGLSDGDVVVLADLNADLPSEESTSSGLTGLSGSDETTSGSGEFPGTGMGGPPGG